MGSSQSTPAPQHVLVVGGTGRTGRRLVSALCDDPNFTVSALVRDADKAQLVFGDKDVDIVHGDLKDVDAWAHNLKGVSQVVTAVSCGQWVDLGVLVGLKPEPANMPYKTDAQGIANLAAAAKEHGVSRIVAVTTASAGSPWSPAAIFLNAVHYLSVKRKWEGEQAIRASGLDYVVLRPYGLGPDAPPGDEPAPAPARGVEWSQGEPVGRERRRIPRDDVARMCHEALRLTPEEAPRATFECWATEKHRRPMDWSALRADPPGPLPEVNHDIPVAMVVGGGVLGVAAILRGSWRLSNRIVNGWLRRP